MSERTETLRRRGLAWSGLLGILVVVLAVGGWFRATHLQWFGEDIPDINAWQAGWQGWVNDHTELRHPAMVHFMPENCLCRFFTAGHASQLSHQALLLGYSVFTLGGDFLDADLARELLNGPDTASPGPMIVLTDKNGRIRYLGPYSDGIRCGSGTSLVDAWLPLERPGQIVTLDVSSCRCQ